MRVSAPQIGEARSSSDAVRAAVDTASAESALAKQAANAEAVRQRAVQASCELARQERELMERAQTLRGEAEGKGGGKGKGGKHDEPRTKKEAFYDRNYDEKRAKRDRDDHKYKYEIRRRKSGMVVTTMAKVVAAGKDKAAMGGCPFLAFPWQMNQVAILDMEHCTPTLCLTDMLAWHP